MYRGLDGAVQGPFSSAGMLGWRQQGYFTGANAVMVPRVVRPARGRAGGGGGGRGGLGARGKGGCLSPSLSRYGLVLVLGLGVAVVLVLEWAAASAKSNWPRVWWMRAAERGGGGLV